MQQVSDESQTAGHLGPDCADPTSSQVGNGWLRSWRTLATR